MDLPLGQSDMFFHQLNTHRYSPVAAGTMSADFLARKGTDGSTVGRGCWRWRRAAGTQRWGTALASSRQPCDSLKSTVGAGLEATQDGGGSRSEERHGMAAAILRIDSRRENPVRGDSGKIFAYPTTSFVVRRLDPCVRPTPPLVGTRLSTGCLRQCV
jgi:hypothetical protein